MLCTESGSVGAYTVTLKKGQERVREIDRE